MREVGEERRNNERGGERQVRRVGKERRGRESMRGGGRKSMRDSEEGNRTER